jgi:hypothetical protein
MSGNFSHPPSSAALFLFQEAPMRKPLATALLFAFVAAAPPAHAQDANSRAGVYYGAQIIYSTLFDNITIGSDSSAANAYGGALYAEKIWESNNAIRGRLVHMDTGTFTDKTHNYMGNVVWYKDRASYTGAIVDYVRYFDTKFVPYVFVGAGCFKPYQMDNGGHYSGYPSDPLKVSFASYYGGGWDYSVRGLRGAAEFGIRIGTEMGQSFEASLSFGFRRGLFSGGRGSK